MRLKQPETGRALLALLFAAAFLANGGAGLWVSLTATPAHVNGLSAVVTVFGLIALGGGRAAIAPDLLLPCEAGEGDPRSGWRGRRCR